MNKVLHIIWGVVLFIPTYAQITENFDGATFPPFGWVEYHTGIDALHDTNSRSYSAPNSALFDDEFDTDTSWLILPQIINLKNSSELTFWQNQNYSSYYEYHGVWLSTSSNNPGSGTFVEVDSIGPGTEDTWEEVTVDLSSYAGQDIYLAFKYIGDFADEWHIDNVMVDTVYVPTCPTPSNVMTTSVGVDSISLNWNSGSGVSYWTVEYGPSGFSVGSGTIAYTNQPLATINGLTQNTKYDFYVKGVCSGINSSGYAPVYSEQTICPSGGTAAIPYTQNFDALTIPSLPCGFVARDYNTDGTQWKTDTTNPNSLSNSLYITYSSPGVPQNDWVFTPGFNITDTGRVYEFGFSYASRSGSAFPEKMEALVTNQTNQTSIVQTLFKDTSILTGNLYVDTSFDVEFSDTGIHYFAFHLFSNADQWDFMIDDIWFQSKPYASINEVARQDILLYPNPTKNTVTVKSPNSIKKLKIFSISGNLLTEIEQNSKTIEVNLQAFEPATYFIQAEVNQQIIIKKVVKVAE